MREMNRVERFGDLLVEIFHLVGLFVIGGTIMVLTMVLCNRPIHQAVATASGASLGGGGGGRRW